MTMTLSELKDFCTPERLAQIPQDMRVEILQSLGNLNKWVPTEGPQADAYHCKADILFFGGSGGCGKTSLICGTAREKHRKSIIFRKQSTQLVDIIDEVRGMCPPGHKYNGKDRIFRFDGIQIEFGSFNNKGDEEGYRGRPHDLKCFDEICTIPKKQFIFLTAWLRTTDPKAPKPRIICTGNPPSDPDGQWVIEYWAPWLDPKHPNPAKAGELRWFTTIDGKDVECPNGDTFKHGNETLTPKSRTFIPALIDDNPYLKDTEYRATLQAMPEPFRSQMLYGDFSAGVEDNAMQVIPTSWIEAAMDRWEPRKIKGVQDSLGVDVGCGGLDQTVISARYGNWFDELITHPGKSTPDGPITAGLVLAARRNMAPIHIDVIGWGKSATDFLVNAKVQTIPCNAASTFESKHQSTATKDGADGVLRFHNHRAMWYWRMREALDPENELAIELPNDPELKSELAAPIWKLTQRGILIESKDDIKDKLGRSPDKADAVVFANICTVKEEVIDNEKYDIPEEASYYS